jgi:hypothetical protein
MPLGIVPPNKTHGESQVPRTPEYTAWMAMNRRCSKPENPLRKNYAGRGITVCEEWKHSYEAFLNALGRKPSSSHSLDRIDNDGNYEPGNVRWATLDEQNANKRTNFLVEFNGTTRTLTEWAKELGLTRPTLTARLKRYGWTVQRAFTEPVNVGHRTRKARPAEAEGRQVLEVLGR